MASGLRSVAHASWVRQDNHQTSRISTSKAASRRLPQVAELFIEHTGHHVIPDPTPRTGEIRIPRSQALVEGHRIGGHLVSLCQGSEGCRQLDQVAPHAL